MKQEYRSFKFKPKTLALITLMNTIVTSYIGQGFVLTVRQLYYQLVTQNVVPNTEKSYKTVTSIVNDARLAGLMDWDGIEDRTRSFTRRQRWTSPADILRAVSQQYHEDLWDGQEERPFVIVEKEALAGVLDLVKIVRDEINSCITSPTNWKKATDHIDAERKKLVKVADDWK